MTTLESRFRPYQHVILLLIATAMLTLQPLTHGYLAGLFIFDGLLTLLLLAAFLVVFRRPGERLLALAIGIPAVASRWIAYAVAGTPLLVATVVHHVLLLTFFAMAVGIVLRGVFAEKTIRADHVAGTVCGYLFAGVVFGNAYILADLLSPQSFNVNSEIAGQLSDAHGRNFLFTYFSFCTLSGGGYGDIMPIGPFVASLTWMEAVFGQFYLAVVVAQLVGLKLAQRMETPHAPAGGQSTPFATERGN